MRFPTLMAVLALVAALPAAAEDLTILSKVSRAGGPPTTTTSYLANDRLRIVQADGREFMIDLKSGDMTVMDGQRRQYFVVTRQDLDQARARIQQQMNDPQMKEAQERMKNLPPEVQKRMQTAMGGLVSSVTVQKTGATRKIAGYSCEDWTVAVGEISRTEECLTTELPLPTQSWEKYRDFAESMRNMTAAMGPMGKGISDLQEKMKDMKGFPLVVKTTAGVLGRTSTTTSEVVEVKRGPIPASAWQIPTGYTKVDNPMLKGGRGR
jgi:hypothetical protein